MKKVTERNTDIRKIVVLEGKLKKMEEDKCTGARISSKIRNTVEGERSTKIFNEVEKARQKVDLIKNVSLEGKNIKDTEGILKAVQEFYGDLFRTEGVEEDEDFLLNQIKMKVKENKKLCDSDITEEEIHEAVRPGSIDPMTAVVQRVKGFAYYSLSFSRHNKNIKMEHFLLYILSRYFI